VIAKVGFCTFLLLWAALAAVGQSRRESLKKCVATDPDTIIAGCTELIQAGREKTASLVGAYKRRGSAYIYKGDSDRAVQDYNEAIRLNHNDAYAYGGRATAYGVKGDFDRVIQDCDSAIRLSPNIAMAYVDRGVAYCAKGDYDRAIEDYDDAIRLDPKGALAYYSRGNAYIEMGDYGRAINDLNEAIRLNPKFTGAYENRGDAYLFQSNLASAIEDFEHVMSSAPSSGEALYAALMLHVAVKRQGRDDAQQLETVAAAADLSKWPGPVLKLDLGQITADEVMAAAANADVYTQKRQICGANYFTGEDALLHNQQATAMAHFEAARDGCPNGSIGYAEALAELRRLSAPGPPAK
jgi:tetratricopeptide (TPR) repeat protein